MFIFHSVREGVLGRGPLSHSRQQWSLVDPPGCLVFLSQSDKHESACPESNAPKVIVRLRLFFASEAAKLDSSGLHQGGPVSPLLTPDLGTTCIESGPLSRMGWQRP